MGQGAQRYVSGPRELVEVPIAAGVVVKVGDSIALDGGYAVPLGDMNDPGDAAANRENAADNFLGIAETAHRSTDAAGTILVDVSCGAIFKLELKSAASLSFGAALEPYSDGGACSDYQFVAGTTSKVAVTPTGAPAASPAVPSSSGPNSCSPTMTPGFGARSNR